MGATARVHQLPAGCTTHSETTTEPSMMQWVMLMDAWSFANNEDETMPSQTRARAPTCWAPSKRHVAFAGIRLIVLTRIVLAEHPMPSPAALVFSFFWGEPATVVSVCQQRLLPIPRLLPWNLREEPFSCDITNCVQRTIPTPLFRRKSIFSQCRQAIP